MENTAQDRDTIFSEPQSAGSKFNFDKRVAAVFDDMIVRSVPQYLEVQQVTAELCLRLAGSDTTVFDLGCSTGTTLVAIANALQDRCVELVGIDNSLAMLDSCRQKLRANSLLERCRLQCADLAVSPPHFDLNNASVVTLHYTLQFIKPALRTRLLQQISAGIVPGGALLLSEKISYENPRTEKLMTELHHAFKQNNGYSELEIARKREALEQVLVPWTLDQNIAALQQAGFTAIDLLLKRYNFVSLLAVR